jgi:hypothetical protein
MKTVCVALVLLLGMMTGAHADDLLAGTAVVDISERAVPVNDPCFAKALVLRRGDTTAVLVTVDAVAIGGIGRIGNGFLANVRTDLQRELGLVPEHLLVNASHCHGVVRTDLPQLVVQAVREAAGRLEPVRAGAGNAHETRISENRRMMLKDGTQADMRRAYAMPRDEDVESVGPIDPQVGLLRLDRLDGTPLAVVYHFACHPIMNPPSRGSSADYPGVASKVIKEATGATAFFLQGCGGDINPRFYKEADRPADAEPLGALLAASVLAALRQIETRPQAELRVHREILALPRAADFAARLDRLESERQRLLDSLRPCTLNFKAFLPLLLQHRLWPETPSHHAAAYLHDPELLRGMDADNRSAVEAYLNNLATMEQLARLNANRRLLKRHQAETEAAGGQPLEAELGGLRIGDFKWVTFPSELTVGIGLNIKREAADPHAHVSGYTNGYLFYTATAVQRNNKGYAQEDCDVLVAPEWQQLFESRALSMLQKLGR